MPRDLPDDMLIAVGHLITRWSTVETVLSLHVARTAAMEHHFEDDTLRFNPQTFLYVTAIALGSSAKATLGQLENLLPMKKAEIRSIGEALLRLKEKRDRIAHNMPGARDGFATFHGVAGSRRNLGTSYDYSATQIEGWGDQLATKINELTAIVEAFTGLTLQQAGEFADKWAANHREEAQRYAALLNRPDSAPPATQEE